MQFICDICGLRTHAIVDGYPFGDGILEDVCFKVTFDKKGNASVETLDDWNSNDHLRNLNKKYWLKEAQKFAESTDVFECPTCGNDIDSPLFNDTTDEPIICTPNKSFLNMSK